MAHILEYYFADDRAITTLAIDDALLKTIVDMTDRLQNNSSDLLARGNLAWCATMALNGISGIGLKGGDWACHDIQHSFSALHPEIAHGEGLGVIFPAWIEYMSEKTLPAFCVGLKMFGMKKMFPELYIDLEINWKVGVWQNPSRDLGNKRI